MNVKEVQEGVLNCVGNLHQLRGLLVHRIQVVVVAHGKLNDFSCENYNEKRFVFFSDPSPGRHPQPTPIECSPRPQAIRRQSSTTEEILIARGFRRQSTTEEMIRCRNFRRQSSQSDDTCQRYSLIEHEFFN